MDLGVNSLDMFPGFEGKGNSDENTSRGDSKDNKPGSISDKLIQASKNKGTKQSSVPIPKLQRTKATRNHFCL